MISVSHSGSISANFPSKFRIGHKSEILKTHTSYSLLLEKARSLTSIKERIVKDLHRTHLISTDESKQVSLCNILLCVAYLFPGISYCQGMNCVAAGLLLVLESEEDSMYMFVSIIQEWPLSKVYEPGLPDLLLREYQFNVYFKRLLPDLFTHFKNEDVTTGFFMSRWYLTIFSIYLPFEICIYIWDCIFNSQWKAIIKISISLMMELKGKLIVMDKAHISCFLRDSMRDFSLNYKKVLSEAWNVKVKKSDLNQLAQEFYIQVADYKLKNIEPYFTEEENTALYETKLKLAEHSEENIRLIKGIQKNIEDQGKKIEDLDREARDMEGQINELELMIENQCDKKVAYLKTLQELQVKVGDESGILNEDLWVIKGKIECIESVLKEMKKEYIDKVIFT